MCHWSLEQGIIDLIQASEEGKTPPEGDDTKADEKPKDEAKTEEKVKESKEKEEVGEVILTAKYGVAIGLSSTQGIVRECSTVLHFFYSIFTVFLGVF